MTVRQEIKVPELGEGVTDGFVVEWLKEVGEHVDEGEGLVEVMTDKANVEVPAPVAGTVVELLVAADTRVKVDQVIAVLESS
ncbi:MAG TPA: biotin/lipoyl-containing protein [Amycolatopsis sp.]|nr:biotin/lipoyl-containing protein [Amycolatopsis sp.]